MLIPETNDMDKYLEMIDIIDFGHDLVKVAAERLKSEVSRKAGIFGKADISKPGGMSCGTSKSGASKYSASKPDISRSGVLECGIPKYVSLKNSYDNPACPVWFEQAYAKAVFEHVRDAFLIHLTCSDPESRFPGYHAKLRTSCCTVTAYAMQNPTCLLPC